MSLDKVAKFQKCPRCDEVALDVLKTHAYCVNCNYCKDIFIQKQIPDWVFEIFEIGTSIMSLPRLKKAI